MLIGAIVRNMGDQSTPEIMGACARAAEEAGPLASIDGR